VYKINVIYILEAADVEAAGPDDEAAIKLTETADTAEVVAVFTRTIA